MTSALYRTQLIFHLALPQKSVAGIGFGGRPVDIVDTGTNVHDSMAVLINNYFAKHLQLSTEDAKMLHQKYYKDYGLAITGLALHHKMDPMEFNREVDDALPLDDLIPPNPRLRELLADIDKTKVKLWLFTNAYITHALRVVRLLGIEDMFEGITYCDYSRIPIRSKPHAEMFERAEVEAGAPSAQDCYFIDDSYLNCYHAQQRGWTTAHIIEPPEKGPEAKASAYQISDLEELREIFPAFFRDDVNGSALRDVNSDSKKEINGSSTREVNGGAFKRVNGNVIGTSFTFNEVDGIAFEDFNNDAVDDLGGRLLKNVNGIAYKDVAAVL
ncbi:MAG: hypothetical protein Q9219_003968 [cf. Caloplaca sp. 3 TL-2023]